ncbi:MAG: alpha-galactosidase, partial [Dehalococcoidales bacterium]|nr:alpha-galactosidase [Dehalococcoidales bacterium]
MPIALRDQLRGVLPAALLQQMNEGPGWQVESGDGPLSWNTVGTPEARNGRLEWVAVHASGLRAKVTADLDEPAGAARMQVELSNPTPHESLPLSAIRPAYLCWRSLPIDHTELRSVSGGLAQSLLPSGAFRETVVATRPGAAKRDHYRLESASDGRSSGRDLPFLQLTIGEGTEAGLVIAMEWSGQWYQDFGPHDEDGSFLWQCGIPVSDLTLAAGETLVLPTVHLIGFKGDRDAGGNAVRRYIYDRVCPDLNGHRPLPPISYDHWFGIGCEFDEALLRTLADRAAELGLEYFVVDAGWYAGCGSGYDYGRGVGNWGTVDRRKFPEGLESFAEYVHGKGLGLGLWFEIERARRDSDLARRHPEWFFDIGAEFLHLNLALADAQEYVIETIGDLIERLDLGWIRWDYNRGPKPYWDSVDPTGKIQFDYVRGLYRVLDEIMAAHPRCLIECCSSGGRRIDLGTMRRAHTAWFSDHTVDPLVCRFMQLPNP